MHVSKLPSHLAGLHQQCFGFFHDDDRNRKIPPPLGRTAAFHMESPLIASLRSKTELRDPRTRRRPYSTALFTVGGGLGDGPPGSPTLNGPGDERRVAVEGHSPSSAEGNSVPSRREADVPNTVIHNGETLTFGDYRRPSIAQRALIMLATFSIVGWKAYNLIQRMRRTWAKAIVAVSAPCVAWLLRSTVAYLYKEILLQPKLRSPESVAFHNSRFKDVNGLKVHYLRETPPSADNGGDGSGGDESPTCVLHMNHGFGASSTSWAPVIAQLSGALGALAVAHDTPGFGLTDRAGLWQAEKYSLRNNADITIDLVQDAVGELRGSNKANSPRYILMGHSMGCITAATTAIDSSLPPEQTTLILVAPALSLPSKKKRSRSPTAASRVSRPDESLVRGGSGGSGRIRTRQRGPGRRILGAMVGVPTSILRTGRDAAFWFFNWCLLPLFYPLEILGLRSLVYGGNFWRAALRVAWVDKAGVNLDVINRYRWPSLVRFWDRGMALFLLDRAQLGRGGTAGPSGLVEAVAAKAGEGMKVVVVQGDKDRLVTLKKATAIANMIPAAKLLVLPECGHVPHEERPDEFLHLVLEQLGEDVAGPGGVENDTAEAASFYTSAGGKVS